MQRAVAFTLAICLSLWLGGLVMLFISVSVLFGQNRDGGVAAAPMLFGAFEKYALILAPVTVAAAFMWHGPGVQVRRVLVACLVTATMLLLLQIFLLTPRINDLRAAGQNKSEAFGRAHAQSTLLYTGTAVLVLIANLAFVQSLLRRAEGRLHDGQLPAAD
ncbi:MAG TPA: hypothetical protein VGB55_02850 [Tepidisphaeraceae bacterium]|jgi:ABC-type Fe3+-siderophore transport system permease subunit